MPELPEVETTRRGLRPLIEQQRIHRLVLRRSRLRWEIPASVQQAQGQQVLGLQRRAKWLIWQLEQGSLLWHLGMSGSFRAWQDAPPPAGPHDHVDIELEGGLLLRYTDPRRFGALLWGGDQPLKHERLARLGPEPLGPEFDGNWLWRNSRGRRAAVKNFIMDRRIVVGVGNIYASEALFAAGIHPRRAAGRVSRQRYQALAEAVRDTLQRAIQAGGTTLRDFTSGDGQPGYFAQELKVYGRDGQPCPRCATLLRRELIGQRSSFYCPRCQR